MGYVGERLEMSVDDLIIELYTALLVFESWDDIETFEFELPHETRHFDLSDIFLNKTVKEK